MTQTYEITVRRVLTRRQRALLDAQRDLISAGDYRNSQACDYAEERIAEAEDDLATHGEEPADDRPITSPPPWTREMGIAALRRLHEARVKRWDRLDAAIAGTSSEVSPGEPVSLAAFCLAHLECIPHELVPYLPGMVESASGDGRSAEDAADVAAIVAEGKRVRSGGVASTVNSEEKR